MYAKVCRALNRTPIGSLFISIYDTTTQPYQHAFSNEELLHIYIPNSNRNADVIMVVYCFKYKTLIFLIQHFKAISLIKS